MQMLKHLPQTKMALTLDGHINKITEKSLI